MREIDSQTKTVRELFTNTKYNLDYYQREYVWESKHVTELIGDLIDEFSNNYKSEDERKEVSNYDHYFLGSIVICQKNDRRFIIDGQQRLTTLTLLLIYLHRWLEEERQQSPLHPLIFSESYGRESFNLDIPERTSIMNALYSGNFFSIKVQPKSIRNIALRYNDIKECFKLPEDHALLHFIDWLLEKVYLVEITTYDDLSAYTTFETMNDRGLSLTPTEMFRGYLLSNVEDTERRNHVIEIWRKQVETLQSMGKEEDSDAIKAWLRSQYVESVSTFEQMGSEFHRWVRNHTNILGLTSSAAFADFIERDFKFYSDWYFQLREASKKFTSGLEPVYYNAQNSFTLQYPILLSSLRVDDSEEDILDKIRIGATYLDILIHRRIWNLKKIDQRAMVDSMCSVIPKIRGKSCNELRDILYTSLQAETEPFVNNNVFCLHGGNKRKIHLILARMIDYVEVQSGRPSRYLEYAKNTGSNGYEIEHIWANHPDWHVDEFTHAFEFELYRNRVGGLLLLPKKISDNYSDLSYTEKCEYYSEQNLLAQSLCEEVYERDSDFRKFCEASCLKFKPHSEFKKKDFDDRQELYLQIAERIWHPDRLKLPYGQEPDPVVKEEGEIIVTPSQENDKHPMWTSEKIRSLVPLERREYYETQYQNKIVEFYVRVAELQNLIQETQWREVLTLKFQRDYCGFYFQHKPVFGVNLYGAPRFCIWITREEAEQFRSQCEFEAYYPQSTYAIYSESITLNVLRPIFEFAYSKHQQLNTVLGDLFEMTVESESSHQTKDENDGIKVEAMEGVPGLIPKVIPSTDNVPEKTIERIKELVPASRREFYETRQNKKVREFYARISKLQNLVQDLGWEEMLTIKFYKFSCGFYFGNKPVFGVNLYGPPRFYVKITETEATQLSHHCQYEAYYLQQAIYPQYATVEELHPILEFAYRKHTGY